MNNKTPALIELSVVIPVSNEEAVLPALFDRLYPVLDRLGLAYEVVFVDAGSRDRSPTLLRQQHKLRPDATRVVLLGNNAGQDLAILAGFEVSLGRRVVTLDADLQSPPEEIPRLLAEMEQGHDYVGGIRRTRGAAKWRERATAAMNRVRERITGVRMTDTGCMLRGYDREIVAAVLKSHEAQPFIPALACLYALNPTEVLVEYDQRAAGESRHPGYRSLLLEFDLMTGFSLVPLRIFSLVGIGLALASFAFVVFLIARGLIVGGDGVSSLLGILFFLAGVVLFGIGLLGVFVGRLYEQSRGRPLYTIRDHLPPLPPQGRGDSWRRDKD